jgi:hypothetical protein
MKQASGCNFAGLCPSVTRNYEAILQLADYNKLIFPKGLSQRGMFGGQFQTPKA